MHFFFENVLLKEKQAELDALNNEIKVVNNQVREAQELLAVTTNNEVNLKMDVFEMKRDMERLAHQQKEELRQVEAVHKEKAKRLEHEIRRLVDHENDYKRYAEAELKIKDAIIDTYVTRLELLSGNAKKMKAVLRIPRLTK